MDYEIFIFNAHAHPTWKMMKQKKNEKKSRMLAMETIMAMKKENIIMKFNMSAIICFTFVQTIWQNSKKFSTFQFVSSFKLHHYKSKPHCSMLNAPLAPIDLCNWAPSCTIHFRFRSPNNAQCTLTITPQKFFFHFFENILFFAVKLKTKFSAMLIVIIIIIRIVYLFWTVQCSIVHP